MFDIPTNDDERRQDVKAKLKDPKWVARVRAGQGDTCTQDLLLRHIYCCLTQGDPGFMYSGGYLQGVLEHMIETGEI